MEGSQNLVLAVLAVGDGAWVEQVIQAREAAATPFWVLRAAFTSYAMGAVVLLFSAPALLLWFFIRAARGPVADGIATSSSSS